MQQNPPSDQAHDVFPAPPTAPPRPAPLPAQVIEVVCCRMTPLQYSLYCHFLQSKATRSLFASQKAARVLSAITSLRKLLNHPKCAAAQLVRLAQLVCLAELTAAPCLMWASATASCSW